MKTRPYSVASITAAFLMAATGPAFGAGTNCGFSVSGNVGLAFGTLDPSVGSVGFATGQVEVGDCKASQTMIVTINQGLRGNRTMQRASGPETIQYAISDVTIQGGSGGPGNGAYKVASFTGTVQPSAYLNAVAGSYSDRITITVTD